MYKLLLSWRYLKTRFIALASIVSVTLGVATLIVVNSVMSGFVFEMKTRLHGILSDVEVAAPLLGEIHYPQQHAQVIRDLLGDDVQSITAVVRNPALLSFNVRGRQMTQQVMLMGIDDHSFGQVTEFHPNLQNAHKRNDFSFDLEESGYPEEIGEAGWGYRREKARQIKRIEAMRREQQAFYDKAAAEYLKQHQQANHEAVAGAPAVGSDFAFDPGESSVQTASFAQSAANQTTSNQDSADNEDTASPGTAISYPPLPKVAPDFENIHAKKTAPPQPFDHQADYIDRNGNQIRKFTPYDSRAQLRAQPDPEDFFDAEKDQHTGIILGLQISKRKTIDQAGQKRDFYMVRPGDDVQIMFPTVGAAAKPVSENCTVVDFYSSNMHEYDSSFAFVPLDKLQKIRGMVDPMTGDASVSSIQIKLKPGADLDAARDTLMAQWPADQYPYDIHTWQDTQRPLLSAVNMELTILNLLLFMIIAVAGFGILATFFMIVVEKTKDIGVLKALGAPSSGVMSIFLGYGMSLGLVGTGAGVVIGLLFVRYINEIANLVQLVTGQEVFDPAIYYFSQIPTIVSPLMVFMVGLGAILIAVLASVLPALRAARLHPVEALRYE